MTQRGCVHKNFDGVAKLSPRHSFVGNSWGSRVAEGVLKLLLLSWFSLGCLFGPARADAMATSLRVMSFNVWTADNSTDGQSGIAAAVNAGQADIVGFQEMGRRGGPTITSTLSMNYDSSSMIASVYPIIDTSLSHGVLVEIAPGNEAYVFNVHLAHAPYGPYQLAGIPYFDGALYDPNEAQDIAAVVQDQRDARGDAVNSLLLEMEPALGSGLPVFLTGDFNEASHLDWTADAAAAGVHSADVPWPTSTAIAEAGMSDSFRSIHLDEVAKPGNTWSPVYGPDYINEGVHEPQDRIDFVYFAGLGVTVTDASTVGPVDSFSDIAVADFPSDHRAVVSTFSLPGCLLLGDFDRDCELTLLDWQVLLENQHADLTGLQPNEAAARGDLNSDFQINQDDFVLFERQFDIVNGAGSFAELILEVPEPSSAGTLFLFCATCGFLRPIANNPSRRVRWNSL